MVTAADNYGALYGLNCYTTTPARAAGTKVGDVKRVRFLEGVAAPSATAANGLVPRRLIGEAPVEADGSINVELPADTPLLLQTVDERGLALGTRTSPCRLPVSQVRPLPVRPPASTSTPVAPAPAASLGCCSARTPPARGTPRSRRLRPR